MMMFCKAGGFTLFDDIYLYLFIKLYCIYMVFIWYLLYEYRQYRDTFRTLEFL